MKIKNQSVYTRLPLFAGLLLFSTLLCTSAVAQQPGTSPVKIYLMMGQSNMEGQGQVAVGYNGAVNPDYTASTPGTLEYIVDDARDPGGNYDFLVDGSGGWVIRDDVWVHYNNSTSTINRRTLNDPTFPINGNLQPGFGPVSPDTIGPELGFGHKMGDVHGEQVLLIKVAFGGRSLFGDFRPPSAGPYPEPQALGEDGYLYKRAIDTVKEVTSNFTTYFPSYNGQGYEIAGMCWHQGWNDKDRSSLEYRTNLAHLIRDLRSDLNVPNCPFVIATSGMSAYKGIELAQLSMENPMFYPEFDGNVSVIDTRNETYFGYAYEQAPADSPKNEDFHWNHNSRTYLHMGMAMGDAMAALSGPRCPSRLGVSSGSGSSDVTLTWQNGSEVPTSVRILRNGVEIAAAAPVSPASYVDSSLTPGTYEYELQFTMPGVPCEPLTLTVNTGITALAATGSSPTVTLNWKNNLTYSAIQISRNGVIIAPALAGDTNTYTDTTAPSGIVLTYTVQPTNGSSDPAVVAIGTNVDTSGDATPPTPATMTWVTPPKAVSSSSITMTATTAYDENGVEYYFTATTGSGNDSGWQSSPTYTDTGLAPATLYGYTVQARDLSVNNVTNTASTEATVITPIAGAVTVADTFTFSGDLATNPAYSSNPGSDGGGADLYGVNKPVTISTTGFTSAGSDKLVGVIMLHNSAAVISQLTSLTYGGVNVFPGIFAGNPDGSSNGSTFMFYLDNPVVDGDLVLNFEAAKNVDEFAIALFALNGTTPGVTETSSGGGNLTPLYASTGDFVLGSSYRNNQSMSVSNAPPYTEIAYPVGNLQGAVGYLVASSSAATAPTFTNTTGATRLAVFAAKTTSADTSAPTLTSTDIVDDRSGAPMNSEFVTYTVTFSEDMDATTVGANDFSNAGTASILIGSATETAPGVFSVAVTPTSVGTLQLQISAGASLTDPAGNPLDTTSPIVDDTTITVNSVNSAPAFSSNPISGADATEDSAYNGTLAGSATDGDSGDTLSYAKVSGPAWLGVAANGALSGTPANGNVGANSFTVSVTDGNIASPIQATLNITVVNTNDAPVFSSNPISGGNVTAGGTYSGTLAGSASDADGNALSYAKVSGPAWLSVAGNGTLSGTPTSSNVGVNSFTVSVTDGIVASPVEATLNIQVNAAPVGLVTVVDTFSFAVHAANNAAYSANPGADGGGSANFTADSPLAIATTGFSAVGSKLVAVLSLHNSGLGIAAPDSVTYGGVAMTIASGPISGFSRGYILYLDDVASDGNFVVNFSSGQIDQIGVALFALNGAAAGTATYTETNSSVSTLASFSATAGDFIVATGQRNNGTVNVAGPGYTGVSLSTSFLKSGVAYQVAETTGIYTAPTFQDATTATSGSANEQIAVFAAEELTATAYETWATTNAPTTGGDLSSDEDGDGVMNGIEFVLGGTGSTNDRDKLPVLSEDGTNMTFSFARAQASIDTSLAVGIEVGTDLSTWPDVYPVPDNATTGPPVSVVKNSSLGYDTVTLSVPMAPDDHKFVRLKVTP